MLKKDNTKKQHVYFPETTEDSFTVKDYIYSRELGRPQNPSTFKNTCECANKETQPKSGVRKILDWLVYNPEEVRELYEDGIYDQKPFSNFMEFNQVSSLNARSNLLDFAARKLSSRLEEREFDMESLDKVFASVWLNDTLVAIGTKCRGLFILDTVSSKRTPVPSICPDDVVSRRDYPSICSGIHSIAVNPSKTLLAVGAGKPNESIQVYQLPSFEPLYLLEGHTDMVFSVSWIDDTTLVSGSRDRSVKTWRLMDEYKCGSFTSLVGVIQKFTPASSETQHGQKVRDLVMDRNRSRLFTLSADGFVKIWDTNKFKVTNSVPLPHTNETVCVALDEGRGIISVGSQAHVSMIDPRQKDVINNFESLDEGWGVRAMSINHNLITIGGGYGRISFYDLRANSYLKWDSNDTPIVKTWLQSGKGSLIKDYIYERHFQGMRINNAIYTVNYDPSGLKLFSAGGPLQLNLKGSYASIWE
jgi:WD repeat-containing protein 40A